MKVSSKIHTYLKERFPLLPAITFSGLFVFVATSYGYGKSAPFELLLISTALLFCFLLRLRLWDEIKDASFDVKHHTDRPIPRGLFSLKDILTASLIVLALECLLQLFFPRTLGLFFLLIVGYSYLMFKEFFIKETLEKNILLYTLSHQIIFLLYILYFFSLGKGALVFPTSIPIVIHILALFIPPFIYEIGRKSRHRISPDGNTTTDTYIYQWGIQKTFTLLLFLLFAEGILLYLVIQSLTLPLGIYLAILTSITLGCIAQNKRVLDTVHHWSLILGMYSLILLALSLL